MNPKEAQAKGVFVALGAVLVIVLIVGIGFGAWNVIQLVTWLGTDLYQRDRVAFDVLILAVLAYLFISIITRASEEHK